MKTEKYKIFIIDDDDMLVEGLARTFGSSGSTVESAMTIKDAVKRLGACFKNSYDFDIIILDVMLPDGRGFDLLKKIRADKITVPIVILSAQNNEMDRVSGLDLGADDYICKPFSLLELQSRVKAAVRRARTTHISSSPKVPKKFSFKKLELDFESGKAVCEGKKIQLSYTELCILKVLIMNPDRVIGREELIDMVWGNNIVESNSLAPHISRLRKKIAPYEDLIKNIPKLGYSLNLEADETPITKK